MDTFNVTPAYDKPSYDVGDVMKVTITGNDVQTTTVVTHGQIGPLALTVTAADGATEILNVPKTDVSITSTTSSPQSVKITAVQDTSPTPHVWVIDPSGLFITATA
jgi:hypothetical protein